MGGKSKGDSLSGPNSARYLMAHKHHDGVEAPQNSLDLPPGTASRLHAINENLTVKQPSSKMDLHHIGTPVKTVINEEDSNIEHNRRGGPGVVARLMGMDPLPPEKGPKIHEKESSDENPRKHVSRVPRFVSTKTDPSTLFSTTFNRSKEESPMNCDQQYSNSSTKTPIAIKPHRREHPQEELLQKFKKEFESWQASKSWECSSKLDHSDNNHGLKNEQSVSREDHNMEKIVRRASSKRYSVQMNPIEDDVNTSGNKIKIAPLQLDGFHHEGILETSMRRKPVSMGNIQEKSRSCSPTRIVILKPSSDINEMEEPRSGSSEAPERSSNMEHFLEEVKERLRLEMEGKGRNDSIRRTNVAHTSLHERSTDPKKLARNIAKHIRENITSEVGATSSVISESGGYKSDFHLHEQESFEYINRDTRKFISDRLKNALKDDTKLEKLVNDGKAGNSLWIKEKERSKSMNEYYTKEGKGASFWEEKKAVNESIPKYLRREHAKMAAFDADTMSPPNLIRSFSAPNYRTASGKLLLEEHLEQTQKPEESEIYSAVINRNKKDGFNFKGRVSNLRRNLSFKGKIFGKKMSSMDESIAETFSSMKPIKTTPLVIRNFGTVQDNYTEVPPTPASLSSGATTENHSPVSPLEAPFAADHSSAQVSGELSLILSESGNLHEEVAINKSEGVTTDALLHSSNETLCIEGHAESYVREILVVSGLYMAPPPLDEALLRSDGQTESISSCIFDEIEDKLYKYGNLDGNCCKLGDIDVDRKLLFDLVNEALPGVLAAHTTPLMSKRWTQSLAQSLRGRKLLDGLLHRIQMYANPKIDQLQSTDKVLAFSVELMSASLEDVSSIEKDFEGLIIGELIDDLISEMLVYDVRPDGWPVSVKTR
ncbi:hypothetical protein KSP39_PZI012686 [Platanthera zijinensis]|uniref:DUF4378 domain-containing protein n=1 Tax=Platanthera zijinensis TaxID=2320716 RepID=A0AAP0G558_9ASPA